MFLPEILLELEFLLLIKRLQHLRRIGLGNRYRLQPFAFEVDNEAVGFVVQDAHLLDVDDIGAVATHQAAGIHAVVGNGLHLAAQHIAGNVAASLIKHVDIVVLCLDII